MTFWRAEADCSVGLVVGGAGEARWGCGGGDRDRDWRSGDDGFWREGEMGLAGGRWSGPLEAMESVGAVSSRWVFEPVVVVAVLAVVGR